MAKKSQTTKKGAALTVATSLVVFGIQMAVQGQYLEGAVAFVLGTLGFIGYEYASDRGQSELANELAKVIGEDTLKELSEATAKEIKEALRQVQASSGSSDSGSQTGSSDNSGSGSSSQSSGSGSQ